MEIFFDTCALLNLLDDAFQYNFIISSVTLVELESIKNNLHKDDQIKYKARKLTNLLLKNRGSYKVIYPTNNDYLVLEDHLIDYNDDYCIVASAANYVKDNYLEKNEYVFVSDDLSCLNMASQLCGLTISTSKPYKEEEYKGYLELNAKNEKDAELISQICSEERTSFFLDNQYIIINDDNTETNDFSAFFSNKGILERVPYRTLTSKIFGTVKPHDVYQMCYIDSLCRNKLTLVTGLAGSGKSYLAFAYMFSCLERGKIDKIIIFANPVASIGSAKLGYYPGSKDSKMLDSQIGNILISKIGDRVQVERYIEDSDIILLPFADIRGYDTTGMNAIVYIPEAQNLDINLMKLALQRIGKDCSCIIDGDKDAQVDSYRYSNGNNGMKRVIEVFKGEDIYGQVHLNHIYRNKIAQIAEKM